MQNACNTASESTRPRVRTCTPSHLHDACTPSVSAGRLAQKAHGSTAPSSNWQVIIDRRREAATSTGAHGLCSKEWAVECLNTKTPAQPAPVTSCVCSCPSEAAEASLSSSRNERPAALSGHWWTHIPGRLGRQRSPRRRRGPTSRQKPSARGSRVVVGEEEFDEAGARGHLCACCRHRCDGNNCTSPETAGETTRKRRRRTHIH